MFMRGFWLLVDLVVAYALIIFVGFTLIGYLLNFSSSSSENIIYNFGNLISIIVGIAYLFIKYKVDFSISWPNKESYKKIAIWGLISGIILGLTNFPYSVLSGETGIPQKFFVDPKHGVGFSFIYLMIVVIAIPFAEEIFFRRLVYRIVKQEFDIFWGVAASTFLFWASHNFYIPIIFSSLVYCYVYEKTNLIGTSILAHLIRNLFWYAAICYKACGS